VLVIEHNLDVVKCADWLIDLGPEGGDRGGELVVAGTPEAVSSHPTSETGKVLRRVLPADGRRHAVGAATSGARKRSRGAD
jgi:excinuclease ABC subunit A